MSLPAFAVENKYFSYFAAILLAIAGVASFFNLGQLEDPEFAVNAPGKDLVYFPGALTAVSVNITHGGNGTATDGLGGVDTMRRYIYIHGTPDDMPLGVPASHGCVRMRSTDIIELYDVVPVGTPVTIVKGAAGL